MRLYWASIHLINRRILNVHLRSYNGRDLKHLMVHGVVKSIRSRSGKRNQSMILLLENTWLNYDAPTNIE